MDFAALQKSIKGELYFGEGMRDSATRKVYATDASVYQELPLAVCLPKTVDDIKRVIQYAREQGISIIPRAAGTSLAGQVVGSGIVVDISRYFTEVLEVNEKEGWVRVQPGVIRDDLNKYLQPYNLMFGPETSTSSRAMIGGMIGNNSCGLHSIIWGDTRSNLLELKVLLADGTETIFTSLTGPEFEAKLHLPSLEGKIYKGLADLLTNTENQKAIRDGFPKPSISRRNTGYALDSLLTMMDQREAINLSALIAGSEGTLCCVVEAKLKLLKLPPVHKGMVAVHHHSIPDALQTNIVALQHHCTASELVDDVILDYTKKNIEQSKNRFFIEGQPRAILMVEFMSDSEAGLIEKRDAFIKDLQSRGMGFAYPFLPGAEANKAWDLRKAGLGLLRNEPGDTQPVNLIEDCAVDVTDLEAYVADVDKLLQQKGLRYSLYAHAGAGELHIEPMINLKSSEGRVVFREVLQETATLIKKYNGSLSGEHGDGRLRGEFIPYVMGAHNYELFQQVKRLFDPYLVFNKGKIVNTPAMNAFLRYEETPVKDLPPTVFSFSEEESILRLAEKCSGSGDCRKTSVTGGTMCPSFMATRNERDSTRARANILRQFYTDGNKSKQAYEEVKDVLDLCLSCKGCKSECPSSVDVGKMKAEFTQHYYKEYGVPRRAWLVGRFTGLMKLASVFSFAYNFLVNTPSIRRTMNRMVGFHPERTMPGVHRLTLRKWFKQQRPAPAGKNKGEVYLFCDEFTNYNDVETGKKAILLLTRLGYQVLLTEHAESGRTFLSKGLLQEAKKKAETNVRLLTPLVSEKTPLIGLEPSAILGFRDEYPQLVSEPYRKDAQQLAKHCFLFEEWLAGEIDRGNVTADVFSDEKKKVLMHGHCHQKALSSMGFVSHCLSLPRNYEVSNIPSGCCGMAGSFGYEREHYEVSMNIGELVLFPAVRAADNAIVAASGTSCRHQIKDGTGKHAKHTAEILYDALIS